MSIIQQHAPHIKNGVEEYESGAFSFLCHKHFAEQNTPVVMIEKFKNKVVSVYRDKRQGDLDLFAVIWDEEKEAPYPYCYGTSKIWYCDNSATIDVTPEIIEKYNLYLKNINKLHRSYQKELNLHIPKVGSLIKSLNTKGKSRKAKGIVEWVGSTKYSGKCVRINKNILIKVEKIMIWDDKSEKWIKPAVWSNDLKRWDLEEIKKKYFHFEK